MNLGVLTSAKFGWVFVVLQIIIIYTIFLFIQKRVESRRKR